MQLPDKINFHSIAQTRLYSLITRFKALCEHGISGMILFTFILIFVQIKFILKKNINLKLRFRLQNKHFCVVNRRKAIKSLVLVSKRSFLSKKNIIQFESCSFRKFFLFYFVFLVA